MFPMRKRRVAGIVARPESSLPLTSLRNGQGGIVAQIGGGQELTERLSSLGIRPGQHITRIGGMFLRGPVTVRVEKTQVAIGYGMATRVTVEPEL